MLMISSLLMCPPDYFQIEYEINPWMSTKRPADPALARDQWNALYEFLTKNLKLDVCLVDPVPGLPDMVFTANAGLARDELFISGNFRKKERRGECRYFEAWFEKNGYSIERMPQNLYFEGEGDILFSDDKNACAGYLIRSDVNSHTRIAGLSGTRVISLELVDPKFYHLDTCFCPLGPESIVYFPGAFDSYALEAIAANYPDRIEVTEREALDFVCNALVIGNHYIQPKGGAENLRPALESRGYSIHEFEMSEFMKAGGAVKCLILRLIETQKEAEYGNKE